MAFRTKKISQMDPKGANLASTDLLEISQLVSGSYVTKSITGAEIISGATTGFVPTSRTLTINGTTQDLSANRTFTISTGITIGTTAITSGTVGRVLFEGTGNVVSESAGLTWNDTTKAFSIVANQNATTSLTLSNNSTGSSSLITSTLISDTAVGNTLLYGSGRVNNNVNQYNTGASYIIDYQGPVSLNLSSTFASGSNSGIRFWTASSTSNGVERMRITSGGNLLINTTTDAGFKLDVNGTARVNTLTIGLGNSQIATNTALGNVALNANTTGASNTAVGYFAMNNNRAGTNNTAVGLQSLLDNQNGNANTSIGRNALLNTTASNNTAIGFQAGSVGVPNTTGENNIFLGYQSTGVSASQSNRTWIGNSSTTTSWLGGSLLIGTTTDVTSSICTLESTTKGFLPPRMTTTQKNAIASPATGLVVYDTTLNKLCVRTASAWETITSL
jgi:hypothetical protein